MPYIEEQRRREIESGEPLLNAGELNYAICRQIMRYIIPREPKAKISYKIINDVMGALEGAKFEFYRKIAANYEDLKEEVNGTVWR